MMKTRQTILAAALAAAFALGVSQHAAADVYAASSLQITNFTVSITGIANPTGTEITSFQERTTNTATLNGASAVTGTGGTGAGAGVLSQSCSGVPGTPDGGVLTNNCNNPGPRVDPGAANAPGGTPTRNNNDFSLFGPATQYSNSDSVITTSELTGDASTNTQQIAESSLTSGSGANANAEITSTTGFSFTFDVTDGGGLVLNFTADPYERSAISGALLSANATPNLAVQFTLTDSLGNQISWQPQGTIANNCSVDSGFGGGPSAACVENNDSSDLNHQIPNSIIPSDVTFDPAAGLFGITITGLASGQYTLSLQAVTSTDVSQRLRAPEPGILALMGIGLMGLFATGRRKKLS